MELEDILKLLQSESLVLREKGGREICKKLKPQLMGYYRQRRLNKVEAEEVIMTSLLKIITKANTVEEPKKFKSWCWQVARNSLYDHFRKYKKYKNEINEEVLENFEIVARITQEKEKITDKEECVQLGIKEFDKAMPDRAYIIHMKMEKFTNQKISERIGKSLAATKEYVSQTYKKLKPFIENCTEGDD